MTDVVHLFFLFYDITISSSFLEVLTYCKVTRKYCKPFLERLGKNGELQY